MHEEGSALDAAEYVHNMRWCRDGERGCQNELQNIVYIAETQLLLKLLSGKASIRCNGGSMDGNEIYRHPTFTTCIDFDGCSCSTFANQSCRISLGSDSAISMHKARNDRYTFPLSRLLIICLLGLLTQITRISEYIVRFIRKKMPQQKLI